MRIHWRKNGISHWQCHFFPFKQRKPQLDKTKKNKTMSIELVQNSQYIEKISKNGENISVHYVVKNSPFNLIAKVKDNEYNFASNKISCELLYDLPGNKNVEFISKKPIEFVANPTPTGHECNIEVRVKVLTTQCEGSLFLIRVRVHASDGSYIEGITDSIKAVSKPEQIRRKIALRDGTDIKKNTRRKKRTRSDELIESLQSIQYVQNKQSEVLNSLCQYLGNMNPSGFPLMNNANVSLNVSQNVQSTNSDTRPAFTIDNSITIDHKVQPTMSYYQVPQKETEDPLQVAYQNLVNAYNQVDPAERPLKMRKIFQDDTSSIKEELTKSFASNVEPVGSVFDSSSLSFNDPYYMTDNLTTITDSCYCPTCPARKELDQINNFYMDFLTDDAVLV
eukprot:TRINITY_DN1325_c0_g1_i4.p1 TRINITY_DN1325_c0_g1~~TRINITY_DN1325_c0_g1_i4.p1  ORF type:complete len:393 (+),score=67.56 TRINITY_DN1325_c0_g1_i4:393-1571(+)